ncbi:MAG: hypothetical protein PVI46_07650, partial [Lysobacterales bacterium]
MRSFLIAMFMSFGLLLVQTVQPASAEENPELAGMAGVSSHIEGLQPYPPAGKGDRTPFDIWRYAGRNGSSFGSPTLPVAWDEWKR